MSGFNRGAVETHYDGVVFRSRLEARWAVFFNAMRVDWQYEPNRYEVGLERPYTPDFYLPRLKVFVEVKADDPSTAARHKADALAINTSIDVVVLAGDVGKARLWGFDGDRVMVLLEWAQCELCALLGLLEEDGDLECGHRRAALTGQLRDAYAAARAYRF